MHKLQSLRTFLVVMPSHLCVHNRKAIPSIYYMQAATSLCLFIMNCLKFFSVNSFFQNTSSSIPFWFLSSPTSLAHKHFFYNSGMSTHLPMATSWFFNQLFRHHTKSSFVILYFLYILLSQYLPSRVPLLCTCQLLLCSLLV